MFTLTFFLYLFKTYCLQFYGDSLWFYNVNCNMAFKHFGIGYHKAVKKILGVPWREHNHIICRVAGILTFDKHLDVSLLRLAFKFFRNPPVFISRNFTFLSLNSYLLKECNSIFCDKYDVTDFIENDYDALLSRIEFVTTQYINDTMD